VTKAASSLAFIYPHTLAINFLAVAKTGLLCGEGGGGILTSSDISSLYVVYL
jgi:hypothetical protein